MELTEQAARALEVVRRDGQDVRFEVGKVCGAARFRLSVRYRALGGDEVRLGLAFSADRVELEALQSHLLATG
ncbi:MAG TPA: hypothetical protein VFP65_06305 [Anaeromyxobacteraceae bacterium]|nr:hypothetical protein [Anaeromyxobacteraceae bacterium]